MSPLIVLACAVLSLGQDRGPILREVEGQVLDLYRQPVAGAAVLINIPDWDERREVIIARTQTDADGRFQIDAMLTDPNFHLIDGRIWVWKPGLGAHRQQLSRYPIQVVLGSAEESELEVQDPKGRPLAGARVFPMLAAEPLRQLFEMLPEEISSDLAGTTDERGRVKVGGVRGVLSYKVVASGFGTQLLTPQLAGSGQPQPLRLWPMGSIEGRIVCEDKSVDLRRPVVLLLDTEEGEFTAFSTGNPSRVETIADETGRFRFAEVPIRTRSIQVVSAYDATYRQIAPLELSLESGKVGEVVLALERRLPGERDPFGRGMPPAPELRDGVTIPGRVVVERDQGVAGARVKVWWRVPAGDADRVYTATAETGARGDFEIGPVESGSELLVHASGSEMATDGLLTRKADPGEPLTIPVSGDNTRAVSGRILDREGRPITGVRVSFSVTLTDDKSQRYYVNWPNRSDPTPLETNSEGTFQSSRILPAKGEIRVSAAGPMVLRHNSTSLPLVDLADGRFPDIALNRIAVVPGRVRDTAGRPIAGVKVFQRGDGLSESEAITDEQGRFILEGYLNGRGFVFAQKPGYRFAAKALTRNEDEFELTLTRRDEPPARRLRSLPPVADENRRRALALRLLKPVIDDALNSQSRDTRFVTVWLLGQLDPALAIERVGQPALEDPWADRYLRRVIIRALAKEHADEAEALIASWAEPDWRAQGYVELARSVDQEDVERIRRFLSTALLHAHGSTVPADRAVSLALIGGGFYDIGEQERGARILEEARRLAEDLAKAPGRGIDANTIARQVARIDFPAAIELARRPDGQPDRSTLWKLVADRLSTNPIEAEELYRSIDENSFQGFIYRSNWLLRNCKSLAPTDLNRALSMAHEVEAPFVRIQCMSVIAETLAEMKRPEAGPLLDDILAFLEQQAVRGGNFFNGNMNQYPPVIAAALLPISEQVDPNRVAEDYARALSLRPPIDSHVDQIGADNEDSARDGLAGFAVLLARFDRETARQVMNAYPQSEQNRLFTRNRIEDLRLDALIDPDAAVERLESLPMTTDSERSISAMIRNSIAQILTCPEALLENVRQYGLSRTPWTQEDD